LGITGTRATADLLLYDLKVTLPNKIASRFDGIPALSTQTQSYLNYST
jgi:hypothetical protein